MTLPTLRTDFYQRLSPWQARGVLICAVAFFICGISLSPARQKLYADNEEATSDDVQLYLAEIDRMRTGEEYYHVAADELVARGFPTRSVFNWRTPLPFWILAALPSPMNGRLVTLGAAILLILLSIKASLREDESLARFALPLSLLLTSPLMQCGSGDLYVMSELWAGLAIALSIAAYGMELWAFAAMMGLAAVFLRDLALPYCVVCLVLSVAKKRTSETQIWIIGLVAWAAFYAHHCWTVSQLIDSNAVAHQKGWIQFGGLGFVLGTVQVNHYLLVLPMPVTVAYLTLSLIGFAGWSSAWGRRTGCVTVLYLVAFCIVGQDFNRYWGFLTVPLLCFGAARAPLSIFELLSAAGFVSKVNSGHVGVVTANSPRSFA